MKIPQPNSPGHTGYLEKFLHFLKDHKPLGHNFRTCIQDYPIYNRRTIDSYNHKLWEYVMDRELKRCFHFPVFESSLNSSVMG